MSGPVRVLVLVGAACLAGAASSGGGSCAGHGSTGGHGMGQHASGGARVCARGGFYDPAREHDRAIVDRELHERVERTHRAQELFARDNPCPANGQASTTCPGYVVECAEPDPARPDRCFDPASLQWRRSRRPRRVRGAGGRRARC